MTDIQAALGSSQLDRLDQYVSRRNEIAKWYNEHLNFEISNPLIQKTDRESACHLYVVRIMDSKHTRDEVFHSLRENDIGVNLHYIPVYRHPFFYTGNYLENAESYYKQAISLPIYPTINDKNLCRVVNCISSFQNNSLRV